MPTRGSHKYDVDRAHRRKDQENSGVPDQHAKEAATADLRRSGEMRGTDPAKDTDRARGPKGER
jgi:hypothetical protein